jgi:glucosylceramidase
VGFQVFTGGASRASRLSLSTLVAALVGATGVGAVFAGVATAGVVSRSGPGVLRTHGLTTAERRAITFGSVRAVDDRSLGLIVTATFRGDVERYLGRGDLSNGLLALVLVPSSPNQASSGLIDAGGGVTQSLIPSGQAGVIRSNNQVIFYLAGSDPSGIAKVKLEVFARRPGGEGASASGARPPGWSEVLDATPTAVSTLAVDPSGLTGGQLRALRNRLADVLSRGVTPELRRQQRARTNLSAAVRIDRLDGEIADLGKLIGQVQALSEASRLPPAVRVVQTDAGLSQHLTPRPGLAMSTVPPPGLPVIQVDDRDRYQQFSGIGAAMTDSSAWLIYDQLAPANRLALLQALFGAPGLPNPLGAPAIHLNFLRVAVGASGAMTVGAPYSYDDVLPGESDPSLAGFSIAHDFAYMLPTLQQALAVNPGLEILANPWSPPGWMKSNDSLHNIGAQGRLLPSAFGPFASYLVKFVEAYESNGVPIDAITPENEPSSGQVSTAYPGMTLPEADEARLIAGYLHPALQAAGLDTRIFGDDFGWDTISSADSLASGPAAGDLSGLAWHCYFGSPNAMSQLHQIAPALDQIVDECSPEIRPFGTPEFLISSLRNWASATAVWSVALDPSGGPIQPGNNCPGCRGPVTIDEQTHTVSFRPEYYQLGQVSAFVQPRAWRIDSKNFGGYAVNASDIETVAAGLDDVAFLNPDGSRVLVAYNNSGKPISFDVESARRYFTYKIPARAMTTFVWDWTR